MSLHDCSYCMGGFDPVLGPVPGIDPGFVPGFVDVGPRLGAAPESVGAGSAEGGGGIGAT